MSCYRFLYKQGFKRASSVCPDWSWAGEDSFRNRIITNIFSFVSRSSNFNPNFPNRFTKLLNVGSKNRDLISAIHISPLQSNHTATQRRILRLGISTSLTNKAQKICTHQTETKYSHINGIVIQRYRCHVTNLDQIIHFYEIETPYFDLLVFSKVFC